jgi:hypothetical protein
MSIRTITATTASVAALLASSGVASARVADEGGIPHAVVGVPHVDPATPQAPRDDSGTGTLAVIAIAGGALLAGAASGFEGARRRRGTAAA